MTDRHATISMSIVTDPTGTRCSEKCPRTEPTKGHWCDAFGPLHGMVRLPACIASETPPTHDYDELDRAMSAASARMIGDAASERDDDAPPASACEPGIEGGRGLDAEIERLTRERDAARAANAALHRRVQRVEAGKPEDAEVIRRLQREVRGMNMTIAAYQRNAPLRTACHPGALYQARKDGLREGYISALWHMAVGAQVATWRATEIRQPDAAYAFRGIAAIAIKALVYLGDERANAWLRGER